MFAFTFESRQYTDSRMPQGYRDSPGLFNAALKQDLTIPEHTVLVQYVDDILLAAPTAAVCLRVTKDNAALQSRL